jgi:enoyl-CoA hydratase
LLPLMKNDSDIDLQLGAETFDKGLNNAVKDNDMNFPADWRLSLSGRKKP